MGSGRTRGSPMRSAVGDPGLVVQGNPWPFHGGRTALPGVLQRNLTPPGAASSCRDGLHLSGCRRFERFNQPLPEP